MELFLTTEEGIGNTEVHGVIAPWTSVLPIPSSVVKKTLLLISFNSLLIDTKQQLIVNGKNTPNIAP